MSAVKLMPSLRGAAYFFYSFVEAVTKACRVIRLLLLLPCHFFFHIRSSTSRSDALAEAVAASRAKDAHISDIKIASAHMERCLAEALEAEYKRAESNAKRLSAALKRNEEAALVATGVKAEVNELSPIQPCVVLELHRQLEAARAEVNVGAKEKRELRAEVMGLKAGVAVMRTKVASLRSILHATRSSAAEVLNIGDDMLDLARENASLRRELSDMRKTAAEVLEAGERGASMIRHRSRLKDPDPLVGVVADAGERVNAAEQAVRKARAAEILAAKRISEAGDEGRRTEAKDLERLLSVLQTDTRAAAGGLLQ